MQEAVCHLVLWGLGALVVLSLISVVLGGLVLLSGMLMKKSGEHLMRTVRFETARYWVQRLEREGLTVAQKEYRRMVRERNPKTASDFAEIADECPLEREQLNVASLSQSPVRNN